jgi:hypothetical protein
VRLRARFLATDGLPGELIAIYSRKWVTHVELLLDSGWTFGAQVQGGLINRSVMDPCYKNVTREEIWSIPVTDDQYALMKSIMGKLQGEQYSERGIVAFALGHVWPSNGRMFCSQFLTYLLNQLGILILAFDPSTYEPGDALQMFMQLSGAQKDK